MILYLLTQILMQESDGLEGGQCIGLTLPCAAIQPNYEE